ncbi:hypothetical protein Tco_0893888 [Tanacetum coccineum]|uniref:Eukaryotic translation initiation factor 3 subunit G N-terminal domain-containing protein n=1 Tax=Tanacetum coccineum TaxID=301880 RepID=A0ABQ5CA80_9ASTR
MQEVILFYNGLDVPTRQILDSKGSIPSKTIADAKIAIQEMAEYSQKWHNGTSSRTRSTKTSDGLAAIQAQLNNLGREIEKVYAAQVECKLCKGPHYTKDCLQKEEGKILEEAYYTQQGIDNKNEYNGAGSNRLIPDKGDLRDYWIEISYDRDFLGRAPSYALIRDPVRRLCHRMIAYSISSRGQAPEKVTGVDLFYLRVVTLELPLIDLHELERLHIYTRRPMRVWSGDKEGGLEILAPTPYSDPPPPPSLHSQHYVIEDERARCVCLFLSYATDLRHDVLGLRGVVESFTTKQSRVSTWLISCMTQLIDANGQTYQPFNRTLVGSSGLSFQRCVRPMTGDASTPAAPHTDAQLDP